MTMNATAEQTSPEVTVWYDSDCPLCVREIRLMRKLDKRQAIDFVSIQGQTGCPLSTDELMKRFHAQERGEDIVSGAAAFAASGYAKLTGKPAACLSIAGPGATNVAPVGGYVMGIPANLPEERLSAAIKALTVFTSPEAQKLYVQNGSRTNPRYSVAADPDVRRASPIFEAVDGMSWRDELQFWPRPPVPEFTGLVQICGEEFHDMLRGIVSPRDALRQAQARADAVIQKNGPK